MYVKKETIKYLSFFFFGTSVLIVILHLLLHPVRVLGMSTSIFYMDEKYTLASFFTVVTAFMAGVNFLILGIRETKKFHKITTYALGMFLITLSLDEFFEIHEYVNGLIKENLSFSTTFGVLSNISWIFPLSLIIVGVFLLLIIKVLREENLNAKRQMVLGILSFVIVLVYELFGSLTFGYDIYVYSVAIEEGFEMIGVSFFLMASYYKSLDV